MIERESKCKLDMLIADVAEFPKFKEHFYSVKALLCPNFKRDLDS